MQIKSPFAIQTDATQARPAVFAGSSPFAQASSVKFGAAADNIHFGASGPNAFDPDTLEYPLSDWYKRAVAIAEEQGGQDKITGLHLLAGIVDELAKVETQGNSTEKKAMLPIIDEVKSALGISGSLEDAATKLIEGAGKAEANPKAAGNLLKALKNFGSKPADYANSAYIENFLKVALNNQLKTAAENADGAISTQAAAQAIIKTAAPPAATEAPTETTAAEAAEETAPTAPTGPEQGSSPMSAAIQKWLDGANEIAATRPDPADQRANALDFLAALVKDVGEKADNLDSIEPDQTSAYHGMIEEFTSIGVEPQELTAWGNELERLAKGGMPGKYDIAAGMFDQIAAQLASIDNYLPQDEQPEAILQGVFNTPFMLQNGNGVMMLPTSNIASAAYQHVSMLAASGETPETPDVDGPDQTAAADDVPQGPKELPGLAQQWQAEAEHKATARGDGKATFVDLAAAALTDIVANGEKYDDLTATEKQTYYPLLAALQARFGLNVDGLKSISTLMEKASTELPNLNIDLSSTKFNDEISTFKEDMPDVHQDMQMDSFLDTILNGRVFFENRRNMQADDSISDMIEKLKHDHNVNTTDPEFLEAPEGMDHGAPKGSGSTSGPAGPAGPAGGTGGPGGSSSAGNGTPASGAGGAGAPPPVNIKASFPELSKYGSDLVGLARQNKLPKAILREEATDRMINVINSGGQRTSILLKAASGEGKTFLLYGLAHRLATNDVPDDLKGAGLVQMDVGSMVAGTQYRGQFEERAKKCFAELKSYADKNPGKKMILFIDDVHTIAGAGASEGGTDLMNIMKESGILENPDISVVGATTPDDWAKSPLRQDNAFEGRFKELAVPPFSNDDKLAILADQSGDMIARNLNVPIETCEFVLNEVRKNFDNNILRNSVDTLNLAGSLALARPMDEAVLIDKIKRKEIFLKALQRQADGGIKLTSRYKRQLDELPGDLRTLNAQLEESRNAKNEGPPEVSEKPVRQAMAILTGETLGVLGEDEIQKLFKVKEIMAKQVVGQPEALGLISRALLEIVIRLKAGSNMDSRPITSMMAVGPTGVGKTLSAEVIAKEFFNDSMIKLDMSEYMDKMATNKITGSAPGYIGYDDTGSLCDKVRDNPQSVLVFDEIEKAHPDVFNLLLQILDKGELTDNHGRKVSFKNTVVMMTSNLKQTEIAELMAKHRAKATGKDPAMEAERLDRDVRKLITTRPDANGQMGPGFKPELLGRLDYVIPYNKLTRKDISSILDVQLRNFNTEKTLRDNGLDVVIAESARKRLIDLAASSADGGGDQEIPGLEFDLEAGELDLGAPATTNINEEGGLLAGARDVRKWFQREVRNNVIKDLIVESMNDDGTPNLREDMPVDSTMTVEYDAKLQKFKVKITKNRKKPVAQADKPAKGADKAAGDETTTTGKGGLDVSA